MLLTCRLSDFAASHRSTARWAFSQKSGTFSPTLKHGIALALLDPSVAEGDEVAIDVRGRAVAGTVVKPPFVQVQVRQD